ncbi:hypothetical protein C7R92_21115 [Brevibacillus porteri]|uniref:Uncharacterized protein n=1 Tax=Brevibacillus porteri TaxID=2126350 RepID=A0ABX5FL29_9BACL|nr:hypothetical protein C7R92_21115 [Brevibacillus porteri]
MMHLPLSFRVIRLGAKPILLSTYVKLSQNFSSCVLCFRSIIPLTLQIFVRIRTLGKFGDEDRNNFYSLLESDGVG